MKKFLILIACILPNLYSFSQNKPWIDFNKSGIKDIYEDPEAEIDARVINLLSLMSIDEKMQLLHEVAPAIPRLGIMKYDHGNEALHGVVRPGKFTVYPQAIGMAATWDPALIYRVATSISDEARARWNELNQGKEQLAKYSDLLTFWSPTVNMARDPRWGRTPETYGEDPFLTAQIGVAFVKGLQGNDPKYLKVVSTPKHFACNNEEHNRFECNAKVSERALRSYYLPAFKSLVTEANAQSIMTAYNAINGVPCTANKWLLTDVLRNEWGFKGYVVSDCGAPGYLFDRHHFIESREDAAAKAMKAGLDLECSGYCSDCFIFRDYLPKAYQIGKITESEINNAAFRVLKARFKLGMFDDPSINPYTKLSSDIIGSYEHRELAREAAQKSIILLKNSNNILPLNSSKIKTIAVLGINAATCEFGDYSGVPLNKPVSPLDGIRIRAGNNIKVFYLPWEGKMAQHEVIPANYFSFFNDKELRSGLKATYFANTELSAPSNFIEVENIMFDPANQPPNPIIPQAPMSIRWEGFITPLITGKYMLGMKKNGGFRLYINDSLIIDNWWSEAKYESVEYNFIAGEKFKITAEYVCRGDNPYCSVSWKTPEKDVSEMYDKDASLARKCDVAVVVLGTNKSIEMEGKDRTSIELPEDQQTYIKKILSANPKTIVVLVAGSSLAINWIDQNVPAIINAWYPGEQGGNAIADVLFGDYNPAGRLPLTYYKGIDDLLPFNDYEVFNGRTYMFFEKQPLYCFGHGLSYTQFTYSDLKLSSQRISTNDSLNIELIVNNSGAFDGDEVVQLYLSHQVPGIKLPIKQLKAFNRLSFKKGEEKRVSFTLHRNDLAYWNENNEFVVAPGKYQLYIGSSSQDIKLNTTFEVHESNL